MSQLQQKYQRRKPKLRFLSEVQLIKRLTIKALGKLKLLSSVQTLKVQEALGLYIAGRIRIALRYLFLKDLLSYAVSSSCEFSGL